MIWHCRHKQAKIERAKENGIATEVNVATTPQMVETINKKGIHPFRNKLHAMVVIDVVIPIEEVEGERSFTKLTSNVTITKKNGHFADECFVSKKNQDDAKLGKQDDEYVLLMVTTKKEDKYRD